MIIINVILFVVVSVILTSLLYLWTEDWPWITKKDKSMAKKLDALLKQKLEL